MSIVYPPRRRNAEVTSPVYSDRAPPTENIAVSLFRQRPWASVSRRMHYVRIVRRPHLTQGRRLNSETAMFPVSVLEALTLEDRHSHVPQAAGSRRSEISPVAGGLRVRLFWSSRAYLEPSPVLVLSGQAPARPATLAAVFGPAWSSRVFCDAERETIKRGIGVATGVAPRPTVSCARTCHPRW